MLLVGSFKGAVRSSKKSVLSDSLRPHGLYSPWNAPGQNAGGGSPSLLQGVFPTQGLNPSLPHRRQIPYQLSHKRNRRILEWVACPFSSGSSWPRNWTGSPALQAGSLLPELPGKHSRSKGFYLFNSCIEYWIYSDAFSSRRRKWATDGLSHTVFTVLVAQLCPALCDP